MLSSDGAYALTNLPNKNDFAKHARCAAAVR